MLGQTFLLADHQKYSLSSSGLKHQGAGFWSVGISRAITDYDARIGSVALHAL